VWGVTLAYHDLQNETVQLNTKKNTAKFYRLDFTAKFYRLDFTAKFYRLDFTA
jgi:hypothetical protein